MLRSLKAIIVLEVSSHFCSNVATENVPIEQDDCSASEIAVYSTPKSVVPEELQTVKISKCKYLPCLICLMTSALIEHIF